MVGNGRRRQQLTLAGRQDSSPLGPVVLKPRPRTQPVLGMTLHRKSLQPVGSHRSNPHPAAPFIPLLTQDRSHTGPSGLGTQTAGGDKGDPVP